jgi:hypothetical protein
MAWLGVGSWVDALGEDILEQNITEREIHLGYLQGVFVLLIGAGPSIGGYIVVAQMLQQYGICSRV